MRIIHNGITYWTAEEEMFECTRKFKYDFVTNIFDDMYITIHLYDDNYKYIYRMFVVADGFNRDDITKIDINNHIIRIADRYDVRYIAIGDFYRTILHRED